MWEEGSGGKGFRVLQELHLRALIQPEGVREICTEEVIPELGFRRWIEEASRIKGGGKAHLFRQKDKMPGTGWNKIEGMVPDFEKMGYTHWKSTWCLEKSIFNYKFLECLPLYMNFFGQDVIMEWPVEKIKE